jgi:ABC-type Fe3+-siderophore transport system permease subunit
LGLSAFVSVFIILTLIDYHMTLKYYDLFGSIYKPEWLDMIFYSIVIALFSIFNYIGSQYKITLLNIEKK